MDVTTFAPALSRIAKPSRPSTSREAGINRSSITSRIAAMAQQFVRAALFKRVPGCGWERRFVRHIAHGPNLIQRFTRHIENRIRQILRRFTYAREQAVLGEQAAPRRLKTRALRRS